MTGIAVLGLGAMGSGLAGNLAAAGHSVTVWNRTRSRADALSAATGVRAEDSPAATVTAADIVLSCVADDEASDAVWLDPNTGALAALSPDSIAVEASTLSPGQVRRVAGAAEARGVRFVEAPIIGSRPQLSARQLVHLCGGDPAAVDDVREMLAVSASRVEYVGPAGHAAVLKLIVNGLLAVQAAAGAELISVLARSAVDLDVALEVLRGLPVTSPALARLLGLMRVRDFAPNFPIRLVAKDLRYAVDLADQLATPTPMLTAALSGFLSADAAGLAELDIAGIADLDSPSASSPAGR